MRKLKFPLLAAIALAAFTFTSCDNDDPETPSAQYELRVVDFEGAALTDGVMADGDYIEKGLTFVNNYLPDDNFWYGFAVSEKTDMTTAGYANQFSVYGSGGYGGSKQFAVVYEASYYGASECSFAGGEEREIEYAWVTNSTYAYLSVTKGDGMGGKIFNTGDKDWFRMVVTGYDAAGKKTASVDVFLADCRGAAPVLMTEWTKVDLTSLGAVNTLGFTFESTDNDPDWGIKTPTYACLDNIAYREYVTKE